MKGLFADSQNYWHLSFGLIYVALSLILAKVSAARNISFFNITFFEFLILVLATFRLIRLFTYDYITKHIREYLDQFPRGLRRELADMLDCPWCSSVWMVLVVVFLFLFPLAKFMLFILALSGAATFVQITIWKIGLEKN